MSRSGKNFTIPVSNGIFDHRKLIAAAIWVFLWLIDHTTKEIPAPDGKTFEGLVHGGQPVPLGTIASTLDMSCDSIREQLAQLAAGGYIRKIFHGVGRPNGYAVINSKRFSNRRTSHPQTPGENARGTPGEIPQGTPGENARGLPEKSPGDPWRKPPGPLEKMPYVDKEGLLQDIYKTKNSDHAHITPDLIARAVCDDCGLSGVDLMRTIGDVAKSELKQGKTPDEVRSAMTESWREHSAALADGKLDPAFSPGPDTFFGKGKWRTKATWKWLEGHKPRPEKSRRYWNGASA